LGCPFHKIRQREALHSILDQLLFHLLPMFVQRTGVGIVTPVTPENTPVKKIGALNRQENLFYPNLFRRARERVTPNGAPERTNDVVPGQLLKDLGKKILRHFAGPGDVFQEHGASRRLCGQDQ
jgi:hypothetical protein